MIIDKRTTLADNVAVNTGAVGVYNIGDQYDTQMLASDAGTGQALWLVIDVGTSFVGGTAQFQLVSDAQVPIALDGSQNVHAVTPARAAAASTAGTRLFAGSLPAGTYERYIGLQQTTSVAAVTAGTVQCFMTFDINAFRAYAVGTTN